MSALYMFWATVNINATAELNSSLALYQQVISAVIWFHSSPGAGKVITYYKEHNESDCPSPGSRV